MKNIFLSLLFILFFTRITVAQGVTDSSITHKTAHIYVDLASIPTLLQAADAITQRSTDPKLIFFKRIKALEPNDEVLLSINAKMVDAKFLGETNYAKFSELIDRNVIPFYKEYSDHNFIVHLNAHHIERSGNILQIIPKDKVKEIHLYDDSIGRSLWDRGTYGNYKELTKDYTVYFHASFYDSKVFPIKTDKMIPVDFQKKASELSDEKREMLAKIVGLDISKVKTMFKNRAVAVFVDDPKLNIETTEALIQKVIKEKPDIKNYAWLYKQHPRVSHSGAVRDILNNYFKNILDIPNSVPLEVLFLIGLTPDYIMGYGSSVFFSFKKEQILGYIQRPVLEIYKQHLLNLDILTPDMIVPFIEEKVD